MTPITDLIETLSHTRMAPDAFNQYAQIDANNAIRRANLTRYLESMLARRPQTLMVMEAPGYRGCRLTGIPVTSRKVMLEGIPAFDFFGAGYQDVTDAGFEAFYSEQSATIVWHLLSELGELPLIWNTFPFHPHEMHNPLSNRKPRTPELAIGLPFLQNVLDIFQPKTVIAVGNVADEALQRLNVAHHKVRHPAQGGKNDFVQGMKRVLGRE